MKSLTLIQAMTYHPTYNSIDRILRELELRGVEVCREEVRQCVCGGVETVFDDMVADILGLPTQKAVKWPLIERPTIKKLNKKPLPKSNYIGVTWNENQRKWVGRIYVDGVTIRLGSSDDEEVIARRYDDYAIPLGRRPNFKQEDTKKYKGVYRDKGGYSVQIHRNGKTEYVGFRKTKREAAILWNKAAAPLGRKLNEVRV